MPRQVVFFPLKLYDRDRSRSRGLLELGEHDRVPAQACLSHLLLPDPGTCIGSHHTMVRTRCSSPEMLSPSQMTTTSSKYSTVCFQCVERLLRMLQHTSAQALQHAGTGGTQQGAARWFPCLEWGVLT